MQSIIDPKLLTRVRVGPLAQYFDVYLTRVEQDGFLSSSVPCQAYAIARFSKWLEQQHIQPEDLDETKVREFLGRDPGVVHHPERATIGRFVAILRGLGVVKTEPPEPVTPVQACVQEYREYLVRDRGLSAASLPNYLSFVDQFLREWFSNGDLCKSL